MALLAFIPCRAASESCGSPLRHKAGAVICILLAITWGCIGGTSVTCAAESLSESEVKAAFLINFPKYVDWPATAFATTNSPIVIAVLGKTDVTDELQKNIAGRIVHGHNLVLKRLAAGAEAGECHILFISATEQPLTPALLAQLKDRNVLTVGESNDFLERGGIINLARREQKIALEVNLTAATQARIKISSKLLSVASVVKGKAK